MGSIMKKMVFLVLIALMMFYLLNSVGQGKNKDQKNISYYELEEKIKEAPINKEIMITETDKGNVRTLIGDKIYITQIQPNGEALKEILASKKINYQYIEEKGRFMSFVQFAFVVLLILFLLNWLLGGNKSEKETKNQSKKIIQRMQKPEITLEKVGGLNDEVKDEIKQLIDIFKNKEDALSLGIKPAKGAILHGPPGTGKTLLAQAIANGLDANFYSTSGSSFSEMFVGVGASRVRELFEDARENTPALIFIDEIDSVAKKRGTANSHEERENTLNELLRQMDGVVSNEGIFIIAATNRLDILDEAILRPGRFDHKILIGYPDLEGRKEIIKIHAENKKMDEEVQSRLEKIAEDTIGYTGAEIENLFNLSAKKALLKNKKEIGMEEINEAIDATILGNKNKPIHDQKTKERVAYHEAGHAILQAVLSNKEIRKATIMPRGGALGYVATTPKEMELSTKTELISEIAMILGGGVAERRRFGEHSIGVSGDVKQAKNIIDKMIEVGMKTTSEFKLTFSEEDEKKYKNDIFDEAKKLAEKTIKEYENEWVMIAELLLKKETIEGKEIQEIVNKKQP